MTTIIKITFLFLSLIHRNATRSLRHRNSIENTPEIIEKQLEMIGYLFGCDPFLPDEIRCDATRCFECNRVATSWECGNITVCNADEHCYTEQLVTSSGNIVFNTGCISKAHCSTRGLPIIGKKSLQSFESRDTDVSTCIECCTDEFCNMKGCGVPEIPLGQRGPYCFTCDAMQDPIDCKSVSLCDQDEMCIMYSEYKFGSLQHTSMRSSCAKQPTCGDAVSQTFSRYKCAPYCCKTDFCNDHCEIVHTSSMTTQHPQTISTYQTKTTEKYSTQSTTIGTTTVQVKVTTKGAAVLPTSHLLTTYKATFYCNTHGGYIHLHQRDAHLCVHIVNHHHASTWDEARKECKRQHGDIVVLDTLEKAILLRQKLDHDFDHRGYWIGARILPGNNHFTWINKQPIDNSEANWDDGQPDNHSKHEDCLVMYRRHAAQRNYQHDANCIERTYNYICER